MVIWATIGMPTQMIHTIVQLHCSYSLYTYTYAARHCTHVVQVQKMSIHANTD